MKTKHLFTVVAALAMCATLLTNCKSKVNDADGINKFLALLSLQIKSKQVDSLAHNFDMPRQKVLVRSLVNLLCGNTGSAKGSKAIFKLELNPTDCDIKAINESTSSVTVGVNFTRDSLAGQTTKLTLRVKRVAQDTYKITDVDNKAFYADYLSYENDVRQKTLTDKDIYTPETLAAFLMADSLKAHYDTIPWFQHVDGLTYYFVATGKLNAEKMAYKDTVPTYKMGLVGPDKKEIVPVQFDLVHNIGATFPSLIEVDKDHRHGFYNIEGEAVLPAEYDQILPLNDNANLAVLRKGDDYYWWKSDYTVSDKDESIKISELLPRIQNIAQTVYQKASAMKNVMENNSREEHNAVYIAPSYLVDLGFYRTIDEFINPLRKNIYGEGTSSVQVKYEGKNDSDNWFTSAFYSIRNYFVGGRSDFYDHKNVIVVNKKTNRIYGTDVTTDFGEESDGDSNNSACAPNIVRQLNDTLYEVRTYGLLSITLHNSNVVDEGPGYHYLVIKNNQLTELRNGRKFTFTKFIKMDDSYLEPCYTAESKSNIRASSPEMLRYMKNEIYADYQYKFKDTVWRDIFVDYLSTYDSNINGYKYNDKVDDSLTAIDKFNLDFINRKLQQSPGSKKVLAAK